MTWMTPSCMDMWSKRWAREDHLAVLSPANFPDHLIDILAPVGLHRAHVKPKKMRSESLQVA